MTSPVVRVLEWSFGEEGDVAADPLLQLLMATTMMSVAGVFVVSPIVSSLARPFGVSGATAGQLMTVFTAPSILLAPVMGMLADRLGRKPVLVGGLLVFGVAGVGVGLVGSFVGALVLRALQGVGYAATIPIAVAIIGDLYEGGREATAQGLRVAGIQTTSFVLPPVAGALVGQSWRYPFLLFGIAIPVAVWAWVALPTFDLEETRSIGRYVRDLGAAVARPLMALVMLSFALRFLLTFAFFAYVSVLLADVLGASAVTSGLVVGIFGITSMVAATQAGRLADRWNALLVMVGGFAVAGGGLATIGVISALPAIGLMTAIFGIGAGVTGPVQKSLVTQLATPSLRAGSVSAAVILQSIGQTAGPLVMGVLIVYLSAADSFLVLGLVGGGLGVASMFGAYWLGGRAGVL